MVEGLKKKGVSVYFKSVEEIELEKELEEKLGSRTVYNLEELEKF